MLSIGSAFPVQYGRNSLYGRWSILDALMCLVLGPKALFGVLDNQAVGCGRLVECRPWVIGDWRLKPPELGLLVAGGPANGSGREYQESSSGTRENVVRRTGSWNELPISADDATTAWDPLVLELRIMYARLFHCWSNKMPSSRRSHPPTLWLHQQ